MAEEVRANRHLGCQITAALALFIGLFSLLNLLGDLATPGFDANDWWIDFRPLPRWAGDAILSPLSLLLIAHAIRLGTSQFQRQLTVALLIPVALAAMWNVAHFYLLLTGGHIRAGVPIPFSAPIAVVLMLIVGNLLTPPSLGRRSWGYWGVFAGTFATCVVAFPLAQMFCFGKTDYQRRADVIVVFGARAYSDGRPSDALADRVRTACSLYKRGVAPKLLFSGGPGDGAVHETECMRRFAVSLGVRNEDILLDPQGVNTAATVANTCAMFDRLSTRRVLAVSHFYHLMRVKMAYQRAGWNVFTVPAKESYTLTRMPYLVAREIVALWAYYLAPLTHAARAV